MITYFKTFFARLAYFSSMREAAINIFMAALLFFMVSIILTNQNLISPQLLYNPFLLYFPMIFGLILINHLDCDNSANMSEWTIISYFGIVRITILRLIAISMPFFVFYLTFIYFSRLSNQIHETIYPISNFLSGLLIAFFIFSYFRKWLVSSIIFIITWNLISIFSLFFKLSGFIFLPLFLFDSDELLKPLISIFFCQFFLFILTILAYLNLKKI